MPYYPEKLSDTSGDLIIKEAHGRGITVLRFPEADPDTVVLEHGDHREPVYYARTNRQGSVSVKISDNKALTSALLRHGHFPVPLEIVTADVEAAAVFLAKHGRVVVKPLGNTGGIGVTPDIATRAQLERAILRAREVNLIENEAGAVVVQQHVAGHDYRLLVIDYQHLFAINRIPAQVAGDGAHTVTELIAEANTIRKANTHIRLSETAQELLVEQGLTEASVPAAAHVVRLERVANYHAGGNLHDVTAQLHPSVQETARAIARYFNLGIVGIDCLSPDIAETIGVVIEINGTPALTIHHFPDQGQPRNAAGAVVDMLFPETAAK